MYENPALISAGFLKEEKDLKGRNCYMNIGRRIIHFLKQESVLCIACLLAVISMFWVIPDAEYLGYPDYRVLALLFCLMAIMEGFKQTGFFTKLAGMLLKKVDTFRELYLVLVLLCFFSSMWITNDVALLTFVPFAILVLKLAGLKEKMIPVIVMQTIAANLGSMLTPVGNPQNLYLYSVSGMSLFEFIKVMAPLTGLSLVLVLLVCFLHPNEPLQEEKLQEVFGNDEGGKSTKNKTIQNVILAVLFLLSLLSVAHILPWQLLFIITVVTCVVIRVIWKESLLLAKVDYGLLLTFLAFFVFIGNMERIEVVRTFLAGILSGRELWMAFGCSQIISNVPAAILLSGFTTAYKELLIGVNIGGLGTLIASLASLISYKMFAVESSKDCKNGKKGAYMGYFTLYNVIFAVILLIAAVWMG